MFLYNKTVKRYSLYKNRLRFKFSYYVYSTFKLSKNKKLTLLQLISFYGRKCHLDIVYRFLYDEKFQCISSINNPIARL